MDKNYILILGMAVTPVLSYGHTVTVINDLPVYRYDEVVEVDTVSIPGISGNPFEIKDKDGSPIPHQSTYDGKLIFPATVPPLSSTVYDISAGESHFVPDTLTCGNFYPRRLDDLAWENDRVAFRAYGPALQASGERAFGYDIWTKSVSSPVVERRYRDALDNGKPYHEDHGDGMDVYTVGPTLGGGTAALVSPTGDIIYPYCFKTYEILDNGPLRFTVRLTYDSQIAGGVEESRVISLDAGEFLNRTDILFNGLSGDYGIAPGIVVHAHNPEGYAFIEDDGIMSYSDLTDNPEAGNGTIFVGVVAPEAESIFFRALDVPEGDAMGHILAQSSFRSPFSYRYYWGAGWSKGGMADMNSWIDYLRGFRQRIDHPLKVEVTGL